MIPAGRVDSEGEDQRSESTDQTQMRRDLGSRGAEPETIAVDLGDILRQVAGAHSVFWGVL